MNNKNIITGIDIGTTKIAVIIAECDENEIKIIGIGEAPSFGLKKGVVVDMGETVESLLSALSKAEKQADVIVENAFVGITGDHIRGINYSGVVTISKSQQPIGQEITQNDIYRVLEHAQSINLSPDRKILHVLSRDFKVDDRSGIKNPKGLAGHRLEAQVHLVTSAINVEKDLESCLRKAGVNILDFILEPLASSHAVLDKNERKLGVVLVDIGGGTTDVIVYHETGVLHSAVIPLGGQNITYDIAYGIQTTIEQAETLKCKYGSAKNALVDSNENITIKGIAGRETKKISKNNLSEIIEPRMDEILRLVKNEIKKSNYLGDFTFGIVLTGGGSQLENIEDLAQEIFQQPIKIGFPKMTSTLSNDINSPRYATGIGLINFANLYWEKNDYLQKNKIPNLYRELINRFKNIFDNWY